MRGSTADRTASGRGRTADGEGARGGDGATTGGREAGGRALLRGTTWLVWRQHRLVLGALLAGAAAAAVWCAVLRGRMAEFIDAHHIAGCSSISLVPRCADTQQTVETFRASYGFSLRLVEMGLLSLPVLIGLFIGAPLIARELESGTHQLVLTQSVSPLRWLTAKLALPAAVVLAATSGLSAVFAWLWQVGGDEVSGSYWYSTLGFHSLGPVPVAYALLGLAIGVLAGLLLRRTVLSMGVTLTAMVLVQFAFTQLRAYLMPAVRSTSPNGKASQLPDTDWLVGQGNYTSSGAPLPASVCPPFPDYEGCLRRHDVAGQYMDRHPVSHHWPLAWIEAGIVMVVAVGLTVLAFRVVRRRHG